MKHSAQMSFFISDLLNLVLGIQQHFICVSQVYRIWEGEDVIAKHSYLSRKLGLPYNVKESVWNNENNRFFPLLILRLVKLFKLSEPSELQLPHMWEERICVCFA